MVLDRAGEVIGRQISRVRDPDTGRADWLLVRSEGHGAQRVVVPTERARLEAGALRVPYPRYVCEAAPCPRALDPMAPEEREGLMVHYRLGPYDRRAAAAPPPSGVDRRL